jgi:adenosylhomocysteine nucleosidase
MVSGQRLLLVGAEAREFSGVLKFCRNVKPLDWPVHWSRRALLNGQEVLLAANGAGAARAAAAVEAAHAAGSLDLICSMGFCGALEDDMRIGDIFVAERVQGDGVEYAAVEPQSARPHRTGVLASIHRVAQTADEKTALRKRGASAVEMEAAGVAAKAVELGLAFYSVRSVTDLAHESFQLDFNAAMRSDGRFATMQLIAASCRRPLSLLPELLRLGRRSYTASRMLGEFLADCRF